MAVLETDRPEFMIHMTTRQLIGVAITGLVTGVVAWLSAWLLSSIVFGPLLCHDTASSQCAAAPAYSEVAALVVATGVGVFGLVRLQVFRPLLVGLAAALSLWGVLAVLMGDSWLVGVSVLAVLYALAYALYAWIARIRSLLMAVIIVVVVLVLIRYLLTT